VYHHYSEFGPGPRRALGLREHLFIRLRMREMAYTRRLPAKQEWVGVALLKYVGPDGRCDPSHETLAKHVGCSVSTVIRALATLAELRVVRWARRLVRDGWRTEQTSNAYVFCDCQNGREAPTVVQLPKKRAAAMRTTGTWPPPPERTVEQQIYELRHDIPMPRSNRSAQPVPPQHSVDQQLAALGFRRDESGEAVPI
jgi:hypothetical protein